MYSAVGGGGHAAALAAHTPLAQHAPPLVYTPPSTPQRPAPSCIGEADPHSPSADALALN
jgi:hypothetical protein